MFAKKKAEDNEEPLVQIDVNANTALLYDDVNTEVAQAITEWIIVENMNPDPADILTLMVNSQGGDLSAAWAIIEVITASKIPVRTIAIGECASAALFICMAGAKGNRIVTPSCSVMSHNFWTSNTGSYSELKDTQKVLDQVDKQIMGHYLQYTGLKEKAIRTKLLNHKDNYMSAQEAVSYGLFDIVTNLSGLFEELQSKVQLSLEVQ